MSVSVLQRLSSVMYTMPNSLYHVNPTTRNFQTKHTEQMKSKILVCQLQAFKTSLCNFVKEFMFILVLLKPDAPENKVYRMVVTAHKVLRGISDRGTDNTRQTMYFLPWASCQIRKNAGCACAGNAGNVWPPPRVSDPDMLHGACETHVPGCMPGSLTSGFLWSRWLEKRSR